jgi:hypothetical protein
VEGTDRGYFQVWCSSSWSRSKLPAGEGTLDPLPLLQQGVPWLEMAIPVLASERGMVMAEEYGRDVIGPWIGWVSGNGWRRAASERLVVGSGGERLEGGQRRKRYA